MNPAVPWPRRFLRLLAALAGMVVCAAVCWGALPRGAAAEGLRIAVLADMNGDYGSTRYHDDLRAAVARVVALRPDLVVLDGDMIAGQRTPALPPARIRAMWAAFHAVVSDPLARAGIAVAPVPGNHDASARPGFAAERRIFAADWAGRPRPATGLAAGSDYPFHYAFRLHGVLVVVLDNTRAGRLPAAQLDWLDRVLAERPGGPAIVFGHLPLWPLTRGRETDITDDPRLKALFERHHVSAYVSGHHHAFYAGTAGGVAYLGTARLGSGQRRLIGQSGAAPRGFSLIAIDGAGGLQIWPFVAPRFTATLDPETLPARIRARLGVLERLDTR